MTSRDDTYRSIGKASAIIIALTLGDKILAVIKEIIVAKTFGISAILDAFNIAYALPGIIVLLISGAITSAFVPLYVDWRDKQGSEEANHHTLVLLYLILLIFGALSAICFLLSPYILPLMDYGMAPHTRRSGILIQRLLVFLIFVDGTNVLLAAILQARKKFLHLQIAPLFVNIVTIVLLLFLYNELGIYTLVWGFLLGAVLKMLYIGTVLKRDGFQIVRRIRPDHHQIKAFVYLALPLIGSELIANVNLLIDQIMATALDPGSVSTLRYAFRVNDMPIQIVIMAITVAIFPYVSEQALKEDYRELRHFFYQGVIFLAFLTLPIIAVVGIFAEDIIAILFQRGAFDARATALTASTLRLYSLGLFFLAYSFLNGVFFSALKDTKPMLYMGFLSIMLNFGFNALFMRLFGVKGIALSTTFTLGIIVACFMILLKRRINLTFTRIRYNLVRILIAVAGMLGPGWILKFYLAGAGLSRFIYFPLISLIILALYTGLCWVMRTEELTFYLKLLRRQRS